MTINDKARDEWLALCRLLAKEQYGDAPLVDDDIERFSALYDEGESVESAVLGVGRRYDLTDAGDTMAGPRRSRLDADDRHATRASIQTRVFTLLEMEAALCVWEATIERLEVERIEANEDTPPSPLIAAHEAFGTVTLRHASYEIGRFVLAVYDAGDTNDAWDGWAYDWEIVPAILDYVEWRVDCDPPFALPAIDPAIIAKTVLARLNAPTPREPQNKH